MGRTIVDTDVLVETEQPNIFTGERYVNITNQLTQVRTHQYENNGWTWTV